MNKLILLALAKSDLGGLRASLVDKKLLVRRVLNILFINSNSLLIR
jgi:hypothetical protein